MCLCNFWFFALSRMHLIGVQWNTFYFVCNYVTFLHVCFIAIYQYENGIVLELYPQHTILTHNRFILLVCVLWQCQLHCEMFNCNKWLILDSDPAAEISTIWSKFYNGSKRVLNYVQKCGTFGNLPWSKTWRCRIKKRPL